MKIKSSGTLTYCMIAASTICAPFVHADLVANGSFCSAGAVACANSGGDLGGWTYTAGDPYYTDTISLGGGIYAAEIGAYYPDSGTTVAQGYISQTLNTVVGQSYTVSFRYGEHNDNATITVPNDPSQCTNQNGCYLDPGNITNTNNPFANPWAQNNDLTVQWGGANVASATNFFTSAISGPNNPDLGRSVGDYFLLGGTQTVVATSTSTTLTFLADDAQQGVILTDISVQATPEPGFVLPGAALLMLGLLVHRRFGRRPTMPSRG